jgi:hypothetical protein
MESQTYAYGARLILLKVWLPSIPNYLMAVFKFSKWVIEAINSQAAKKEEMIKMVTTSIIYLIVNL